MTDALDGSEEGWFGGAVSAVHPTVDSWDVPGNARAPTHTRGEAVKCERILNQRIEGSSTEEERPIQKICSNHREAEQ